MSEKRRMRTSEEMFPVVEHWQKSGMGKQRFAKKHGIGYGTFQYWCSRYRNQGADTAVARREVLHVAEPVFVPLQFTEEQTAVVASVVIMLPSGIRIEVS